VTQPTNRRPRRQTPHEMPCWPCAARSARPVIGQDAVVSGLVIALLLPRPRVVGGCFPASQRRCWYERLAAALQLDFKACASLLRELDGRGRRHRVACIRCPHSGIRVPLRTGVHQSVAGRRDQQDPRPRRRPPFLRQWRNAQVSVEGEGRGPLPDPFIVAATQNPIEYEGTYQLPEGAAGPLPAETQRAPAAPGSGDRDPGPATARGFDPPRPVGG